MVTGGLGGTEGTKWSFVVNRQVRCGAAAGAIHVSMRCRKCKRPMETVEVSAWSEARIQSSSDKCRGGTRRESASRSSVRPRELDVGESV